MQRKEIISILKQWRDLARNAEISTGCCMCGSLVSHHGMGDGHAPVDEGAYYADKLTRETEALIKRLKDERSTLAKLVDKSRAYLARAFP